MTSKSKNAVRSFETEIEKCREESNWKKAVELAQQLKAKSPQHESLTCFLIGEGKLELHLTEWPPYPSNNEKAQVSLSDAKNLLMLATDEMGKTAGVALDAHLLLGKLSYACGDIEGALLHFKTAELDNLTEKELPIRSLRIIAESFAIKGLCLEEDKTHSTSSKFKLAERENEIIHSYEVSSDLSLTYMQRIHSSTSTFPLLETAILKAPAMLLRAGKPDRALHRYRLLLSAVECPASQSLRVTLLLQLAQLLARGHFRKVYTAAVSPSPATNSLSRRRDETYSEGPWRPKRYAALNQFFGACEREEWLLLSMVGVASSGRECVLSQSEEFSFSRDRALSKAIETHLYLTLINTRWRLLALTKEFSERAMKYAFSNAFLWRQRALITLSSAIKDFYDDRPERGSTEWRGAVESESICSRALRLSPTDVALRLLTAKTRFYMGMIEEGLSISEEALKIEKEQNGPLLARCYMFVGIGHLFLSQRHQPRALKEATIESSVRNLLLSVQKDSNDHLAMYNLAVHYASIGKRNEAMALCRSSLSRCSSFSCSVRLALSLSSSVTPQKNLYWLQGLHGHMQQLTCTDPEEALSIGKELLSYMYSSEAEDEFGIHEANQTIGSDVLSERTVESSRFIRPSDSASGSMLTSLTSKRAKLWLNLAQISLSLGRQNVAAGCVTQAAALTPVNYLLFYTRGLLHASNEEWPLALQNFQNAVALEPTHVDSLLELGNAYISCGSYRLALTTLRRALRSPSPCRRLLRLLSLAHSLLGEHLAAADAAAAALATPTKPYLYVVY